ncbi:hypothetical protein ACFL03_06610 [Thermodesulfobacteriota bacterium]
MDLKKSEIVDVLDEFNSQCTLNMYNAGVSQNVTVPLPIRGITICIELSKPDDDPEVDTESGNCKKKIGGTSHSKS